MKLTLKISQRLSEDSAQELKLNDRAPEEVITTLVAGGGPGIVRIPVSTTDLQVSLNGLTSAKFLSIECDYPVTIKLNSTNAAAAIKLTPVAHTEGSSRVIDMKGRIVLVTEDVTALYISNADATNVATVSISAAG